MSRHWKPDEELARTGEAIPWGLVQTRVQRADRPWSDDAKAALVLLAGVCLFVAAGFFQVL
jgi:hypothetical protein